MKVIQGKQHITVFLYGVDAISLHAVNQVFVIKNTIFEFFHPFIEKYGGRRCWMREMNEIVKASSLNSILIDSTYLEFLLSLRYPTQPAPHTNSTTTTQPEPQVVSYEHSLKNTRQNNKHKQYHMQNNI